jgi:5,10-methenyltetrahydrofolate synthetase
MNGENDVNGVPRIPCDPAPPPAQTPDAKALLRQTLLGTRRALDTGSRTLWDALIGARVLDWCAARRVASLGVYWPLRGEPDLSAAYAELARLGVPLMLPVVVARDAPLRFAAWTPGEPMHKDSMGIAVPAQLRIVPTPQALLVPCLGFNIGKMRLGYGGGFYDRTLEQLPRPATLGIAYATLAAEFEGQAHDIALDNIATEDGLI